MIIKLAAVFIVSLYISQRSSALAFAFIVGVLALHLLGRVLAFAARNFFCGLFVAFGIKESGLLKQLRPSHARGRRARTHFPWEERGDDLPPEL